MKAVLLISLLALVSCATSAKKTNRLSLGMSKNEVIEKIGVSPDESRAAEGHTFLIYKMREKLPESDVARVSIGIVTFGITEIVAPWQDYVFVFDQENKLQKYGRVGDFGTTRPDTIKVIHSKE